MRLRKFGESKQIYDAFRKRWVALTPEEWVRQHFLHYLVVGMQYPRNRIAVEFSLSVNNMRKRADIVVFDASMQAWMLVECKQADVQLSQAVFDQVARYNLRLNVPFLVVTNGLAVMAAKIENAEITMLNILPVASIG